MPTPLPPQPETEKDKEEVHHHLKTIRTLSGDAAEFLKKEGYSEVSIALAERRRLAEEERTKLPTTSVSPFEKPPPQAAVPPKPPPTKAPTPLPQLTKPPPLTPKSPPQTPQPPPPAPLPSKPPPPIPTKIPKIEEHPLLLRPPPPPPPPPPRTPTEPQLTFQPLKAFGKGHPKPQILERPLSEKKVSIGFGTKPEPRRNWLLIAGFGLFLIAVAGGAVWLYLAKQGGEDGSRTLPPAPPIEATSWVALEERTIPEARRELVGSLRERFSSDSVPEGGIKNYIITANPSTGLGENLDSERLLSLLDSTAPQHLVRNLEGKYRIGIIRVALRNNPFLILTSESYDHVLAGMLDWEETLGRGELWTLFTEESTPNLKFTDRLVGGEPTRVLLKLGTEAIFLYSIVNGGNLIITTSEDAFRALLPKP